MQHGGQLSISTVVLAELYTWAYRRRSPRKLLKVLDDDLLSVTSVLDFDSPCAEQFGQLQAQLLDAGTPADPSDLMIASTALRHNLTVVTHNLRHFEAIPGLRVEDWLSK